eukprot:8412651-Lingulodinium_polyedra.AAC.1
MARAAHRHRLARQRRQRAWQATSSRGGAPRPQRSMRQQPRETQLRAPQRGLPQSHDRTPPPPQA